MGEDAGDDASEDDEQQQPGQTKEAPVETAGALKGQVPSNINILHRDSEEVVHETKESMAAA